MDAEAQKGNSGMIFIQLSDQVNTVTYSLYISVVDDFEYEPEPEPEIETTVVMKEQPIKQQVIDEAEV